MLNHSAPVGPVRSVGTRWRDANGESPGRGGGLDRDGLRLSGFFAENQHEPLMGCPGSNFENTGAGELDDHAAQMRRGKMIGATKSPPGKGAAAPLPGGKRAGGGHGAARHPERHRWFDLGAAEVASLVPGCALVLLLGLGFAGEVLAVETRVSALREPLELSFLTAFIAALFIARRARLRLEHQVVYFNQLASVDPLTGLANRRSLTEAVERELERCRRSGGQCAVVVWDLNGFKALNDEQGHGAGDRLLQRFAHTLRSCARAADLPARAGGDEFVLLMADASEAGARALNDRLEHALAETWRESGCSASMGVATYPEDGGCFDELVTTADRRMYEAKRTPRAGVHPITPR